MESEHITDDVITYNIDVVPASRWYTDYEKWACAVARRQLRGEKWDQRYPKLRRM